MNTYNDDSIQTLDPIDHIKLRPGMYVGDTSTPNQLLLEIFSNALDEYNIGHGEEIHVTIQQNNVCKVKDYAQGFPINVVREDGKTVLEASFSVINSSGKFTEDGVYGGNSLGLNGLGGKISNFLSEWFEVISWNKGKFEKLFFKEGILESRETGSWTDKKHPSGTEVTYLPSKKYFDTDVTSIKYFNDFFNDITCLCSGLKIYFNNELIEHKSIEELINIKNKNNIELIENRLVIQYKKGTNKFDLALSYNDTGSSNIIAYVNYGLTTIGPHITSIKTTITRVLNKWAKEKGILKASDKNLEGNNLQEGMLLVCNLVTTNVSYNAQVKTTITKIDSGFATNKLAEELEIWLDNNPEDGKIIIEKALLARKATEAAKKAREQVKAKASQSTEKAQKKTFISMPTTLIDATSKNRQECELIVVEGLSAASSLVAERDAKTVAVYSVRGMMLNVQKSAKEKILANKEINNLITALGLDYNPKTGEMEYNKNKLRYGKIIACSDADPAGASIENLLFNIIWQLCPDLIIKGHVYSAEPPLYRVTTKKNEYFFLADAKDLAEFQKTHHNIKEVQRAKGLAELMPKQLAACVLNKDTRKIKQLVVSDIVATDKLFTDLYGKEVPPRVKFINDNIWDVQVDYE